MKAMALLICFQESHRFLYRKIAFRQKYVSVYLAATLSIENGVRMISVLRF